MDIANQDIALEVVGRRLPRRDARERVTGEAVYPADFNLPHQAWGAVKRSPHAHARILRIDAAKALALDGVLAVVTAEDFPVLPLDASVPFGETGQGVWSIGQGCMARGKVLWVGQPVAAVAAIDRHVADAALALIDVTYEPLPPAMTIEAALAPGAPVLHEHLMTKGLEPPPRAPSNVGARTVVARGEAGRAMAGAHCVVERSAKVDTAHQGYIEPHAVVAQVDANGFATVWASTQGHFNTELQMAAILGWPTSRLKVVPLEIGGGFGGKIIAHIEPVAVKLAEQCRRPVKMVMSRDEVMVGTGPAAGALIDVKVGADREGRVEAIEARYRMDAGGYPGLPTILLMQASVALYQRHEPALQLEGFDIVTTKPRTEAYRGPGGPQGAFAVEVAMDELSQRLGLDPLEFRRRNATVTGNLMPNGQKFPSVGLEKILDAVGAHPCWRKPLSKGRHPRGRGLALGYWRGTSMTSAAHVTIAGDGRPMVTMGAVDISGTRTTMAQIAAEEFGLPAEDIFIHTGDSKSVGYSDAAAGSRVGRTMAAAVAEACQDALAELKRRAAERLQCPPEDIVYGAGVFRAETAGMGAPSITLQQLMRATLTDGAVVGRGTSTKLPLGVEIGAHVADVEVDPGTGLVTVLRYTAFQDPGRAINPAAVEGQIEGSVAQGLGWALSEGYDYDANGRLRNASLLDYRLPTALDLPPIDSVIVETPVPGVPYGLRGVGEVPIVPPAAAVANAIARAVGVRLEHMPMTPERVLRALRGAELGKV